MSLFNKSQSHLGLINVIRCDEPSYLIWKWHPAGTQPGESRRENAIRWGSPLRVKDGEVAVFVYKQPNGIMQDYIEGPFDKEIKTDNFPVLASLVGLAYGGGTPFQAEVYFINLAKVIQVKFGVPYFDVYDPRFADFGVPVAVRGTLSFRIDNYREFIKLHRLSSFSLDDFQRQIRDSVIRYVKDAVANAPAANNIPVIQLESKISMINDTVEYDISERLKESFGVTVTGVDIGAMEIDKTSDGYARLMSVTQQPAADTIRAQTAANIRNIYDKQRIDAENYAENLRIQREEAQYAQHKQTQTANFAAYQTEAQTEVGIAGANALGQMGANGAGIVNLGGADGFNPAAMMAGMALGGAVGQNIAGTMNSMMSEAAQQPSVGTVPPPVPTTAYHVAVNGQPTGPFDIATLTGMAASGQFTKSSFVWKAGMPNWERAETVEELKGVLEQANPPVLPAE